MCYCEVTQEKTEASYQVTETKNLLIRKHTCAQSTEDGVVAEQRRKDRRNEIFQPTLSSDSPLAWPRWPWPRSSFHPRSVVLPSASTILPSVSLLHRSASFSFSSSSSASSSLLTQSLAKVHVILYLILHASHFGCHSGESISNMSSPVVWSAGHSSVNVCYVH